MILQSRDYQTAAVQSLYDYFSSAAGNPVIAMPTGTGKSVVIAEFLRSVYLRFPHQRVMVVTHVKELIQQNYLKLLSVWPSAPAGVYSAGLNKRDLLAPITFAGIASVAKRAHQFGHIDLLIIDEAHLVSPTEETMYQNFILALKTTNPHLKVIGLTATPWRLGHGKIVEGGIFTDVCFDMTGLHAFNWLIAEGYLSTLVPKNTVSLLDVDGVHLRGGEFIASELQEAVDKSHITEAALQEMIEGGRDRHKWLLFCAGVDHAVHASDMLNDMGIPCEAVHSKLSSADRDRILKRSRAGELRAITNNNVLTTGYDDPSIDFIGMLRPTASAVLWVQMLGRGTRPVFADGFDLDTTEGRLAAIAAGPKQNCLVYDFARNTKRLGPINDPVIPHKKGEKGGDAPVKLCQECGIWNHASVRACAYCGAQFPALQLKITQNASTDVLIKTTEQPVVEMFEIDHLTYSVHTKTGRPDMLRVTYYSGLRSFSEFICIEHEGYAGRLAKQRWAERTSLPFPSSTKQACELVGQLAPATHIDVWVNKKYPEIMRRCFDGSAFGREAVGASMPPTVGGAKVAARPTGDEFDDDIPF